MLVLLTRLLLLSIVIFPILVAFPIRTQLLRAAMVSLASFILLGLLLALWRHRWVRVACVAFLALGLLFFAVPTRPPSVDSLRKRFVQELHRYHDTRYIWGGESWLGVDCSGLIRSAMVDALAKESLTGWQPRYLRQAADLWWHDTSAAAMASGHRGLFLPFAATPSLNEADYTMLQPGDLAVTRSGLHVLVYLGDRRWIEADPSEKRVITLTAPSENAWFQGPMQLVRWRYLEGPATSVAPYVPQP